MAGSAMLREIQKFDVACADSDRQTSGVEPDLQDGAGRGCT